MPDETQSETIHNIEDLNVLFEPKGQQTSGGECTCQGQTARPELTKGHKVRKEHFGLFSYRLSDLLHQALN